MHRKETSHTRQFVNQGIFDDSTSSCSAVLDLYEDYRDQCASKNQVKLIEQHLADCADCKASVVETEKFIAFARFHLNDFADQQSDTEPEAYQRGKTSVASEQRQQRVFAFLKRELGDRFQLSGN